jgi:DNA-binding LacI/PurR family transcriptional regulator
MTEAAERPTLKAPTLYDVAKVAGVSHQTVSRVVKGHTNIGPEIRERVDAAIIQLNYKPNLLARSLATSKSHRIGALVYELLESGPSKIMESASRRAREAGYLLDIVSLDPEDEDGISQAIALINQPELAGLIAFTPTDHVVDALKHASFLVPISLESEANDWAENTSSGMGEDGVDAMIAHLAGLGHERFFHLSGPPGWLSARGRAAAYERSVTDRGLQSMGQIAGNWSSRSGYEAAMNLPLDIGVTALVVANDQMALGALAALENRGLTIPQDLSVVGFDDIPESQYFHPPLTTVRFDFAQQGRTAVDRLLARIDGVVPSSAVQPDPPVIVVRASSGPSPVR